MPDAQEPDHYAGERLREALAADARVSDLSVQVSIVAGNVFVTGQVQTEERVEAAPRSRPGSSPTTSCTTTSP
jgi:osmotically-inducible protein OsmY